MTPFQTCRLMARHLCLSAASAAALTLWTLSGAPSALAAEEEFAPGYSDCLAKAVSSRDIQQCTNDAYTYWDNILNTNYALALQQCDQASDAKLCREKLRKAQRLWVQYKEAMADAIGELEGGSLGRLLASDFAASETKKQARLLMPDNED